MNVTPADVMSIFQMKYGAPDSLGPNPRRRFRYGYFSPDDYYEALVDKLVTPGCRWLDVGGGRDVFPNNLELSRRLAERCGWLTGVDPSPNIHENPYAREKVQAFIEEYRSPEPFDLLTMRMVAEHVTEPDAAVAAMARLLKPGGRLVIYTINKFSPVSAIAWVTPFWLHHPIKKFVWRTEAKDTFPVAYRMNTQWQLQRLARKHGLTEESFAHLDDCRTFFRFKWLNYVELTIWKVLRAVRLQYPENCLLGLYRKSEKPSG
ncbi:class I SAM-dependent methyltransferase [Fimbriiglobus ruber]|nr:class I SAM-dependent methyltransferase [Fimbriiglobus ruber]